MTTATRAALVALGITEAAVNAMAKEAWPAGVSRNPDDWNDYDRRALPIYAANCVEPDWQDYYEQEYMDFIGYMKTRGI